MLRNNELSFQITEIEPRLVDLVIINNNNNV